MACSEEELKSLLVDVGNKLQKPPTSVKELISLLDRVEVYLSRVEQSPSKEIHSALSPTMKALVSEELLRHADIDVKVSVASCISEITRITAPEVPYEDELMKEVFQLIVWSFEGLPDMSSQSFIKRTCVLETVAKVRSCVVMLDLECDELILEMFRHFIRTIRDYHPENVYSCMESIMTRVIDESEEISSDMLFCILDTVRNDNKVVTPIAQKLLKKVIETCADKLKPCLEIAIKTKGVSLVDYDEVVSVICNEATAETVIQSEPTDASIVNVTAEETQALAVNSTEPPADGLAELVMSNGNAGVEADALSGSSTLQDLKPSNDDKTSETFTAHPSASVSDPYRLGVETDTKASEAVIENPEIKDGDLDVEKVDEAKLATEQKIEKVAKKRGRKPKAKKKASAPKLDVKSSNFVNQSDDLVESLKNFKEISPPPEESVNKADVNSLPRLPEVHDGPSEEIIGKLGVKLDGSPKSKPSISSSDNHTLSDEHKTAYVGDLKEETNIRTVEPSDLKAIDSVVGASVDILDIGDNENMDKTTTLPSDDSQEIAAPTIDEIEETEVSAGKSPEQVDVLSGDSHKVEDGPKTEEGTKKRGRGNATTKKLHTDTIIEKNNKEATADKPALKPLKDKGPGEIKDTPKTRNKRKHVEMNSNESKDYGAELVGSKVKVWWPADKRFYKGVIELFDSAKKKHKVLYADGEVENLVLNKQRWAVIDPDEDSDTDEETHQETPATEKLDKTKEVNDGTSKKKLGRPPSKKSESASNKPGHKPKDNAKSDSKSRDDSKAGPKARTDTSQEKEKSTLESSKKLGRPKAEPSKAAGKSKSIANSIAEDAKSSEKLKGGDSKVQVDDNSILKRKDTKVKETKAGKETLAEISAGKLKNKTPSKSKNDSVVKEDTTAVSDAENEGISPKTSLSKASGEVVLDHPSGSKGDEATEKQTSSPAKAAGSLKRKGTLDKGNKGGTKPESKGKKVRNK